MKIRSKRKLTGLALAASMAAGLCTSQAQTADRIITTFDNGVDGVQPDGCGWWYGTGQAGFDSTVNNTLDNPSSGSLYIQTTWGGGDSPIAQYICTPGNNFWWAGGGTFNFSEYKSLQFDLKWDPSSTVTVEQWNDPSLYPHGSLAGSVPGLEIATASGSGTSATLMTTNIPTAAASGWVRIVVPIDSTQSGIDPSVGILLKKWLNNNGSITEFGTANFWIDNVFLEGTAAPPPPPTIAMPQKPIAGLNVFASTKNNSFYDRQEIMARETFGLSWINNASVGNPVEYSFTLADFPTDPATYGCEGYLFFSPNPGWNPSAPDWNNTNCAFVKIQVGPEGAVMRFQYKVDEPNQQGMYAGGYNPDLNIYYTNAPGSWDGVTADYYESGFLGSVTNPTPVGKWTVRFTSDTNVTLIAPNNTTTSFTIPPYNVSKLAPTDAGFNLYLGFQANNEATINRAAVFSRLTVTGVPSAFDENFLEQTELDTEVRWDRLVSGGPGGVVVVPTNAVYWVSWSLPDSNFSLETAGLLTEPFAWASATGPRVPLLNKRSQLILQSDLPEGDAAFFRLVKRAFSKLQVLLPGETEAPNTPTGKTGTPTPVNAGDFVTVTVRAVDSNWNLVTSVMDVVSLTSSDPTDVMGLDAALSGGVGSFMIQVGDPGTRTLTATDLTDETKTPGTSASLTVN